MPPSHPFRAVLAGTVLAFLTLLSTPASAAPPPGAEGFTDYFLTKLSGTMPTAMLKILGPLTIEIRYGNGAIGTTHLNRVWQFCAANAPPDCEQAVDRLVGQVSVEPQPHRMLDPSTVRVAVRTLEMVRNSQRVAGTEIGAKIVAAPPAGDLQIVCMLDQPTTIRYMLEADLAELGLTKDEAIALGTKNLAANLKPLFEVLMNTPGEATADATGDDYESGRVVLHDDPDLVRLSHDWGDRLIVAVPGTHTMLFADGRRINALPAMRAAVREEMTQAERPISATLLLWTKTGWEVIPPQRVTIPPLQNGASTER
ncbi:MAG: hypothetical protein JWL84_6323 [Rhodospirillales bacterium]|jgi:hypothetical protein|nr:hypothetical protein [Rhodospirillales bacterium]